MGIFGLLCVYDPFSIRGIQYPGITNCQEHKPFREYFIDAFNFTVAVFRLTKVQ